MMIADIKLAPQVQWVDSESLLYAYREGKLDATEGRERSFVTADRDEADAYRQGWTKGSSIVAMLAGSDVDILPDTLWADETSDNLPDDLDFGRMLDAMQEAAPVEQVLTPAQSDAYNWGWIAWITGLDKRNLCEWAQRGWQDAEDNYGQERRAEREMFAQTVNPNWVAE